MILFSILMYLCFFFSVLEILVRSIVRRFLKASFLCNHIQNCSEKSLSGYEYNPEGILPSPTHIPLSPPLHACPQTHTNMNKSIGLVPVLFMEYHTQKLDNLWSDCFGVGGGGDSHLFMHPFFSNREWRLIYSQVKLSIWINLQRSYSLFCARFIEIIYFNI